MSRLRIQFPWGGQNDDRSFTDQPQNTTRQAVNVRGYSPKSGRLQGGQRSGLTPYLGGGNQALAGENTPVQALSSVSYKQDTYSYAALGRPSNADPKPTIEWESVLPLKDDGQDVLLDVQQNAFVLSASGTIVKFNADGEEVYSFQVPLVPGEAPSKRFALDGDAGIYVGAAGSTGARVFRYLETDDGDGVEVQWIHRTDGTEITDMLIYAGALYFAVNHEDTDVPSRVVLLDSLTGSEPIEVLSRDLPSPVHQIAFSRGGLVFACPNNSDRGPQPVGDGVVETAVSWTPYDLPQSEDRLHAHYSAWGLGGFSPGQPITTWEDQRASEAAAQSATAPTDDTNRNFVQSLAWDPAAGTGPSSPRYMSSVVGPYPGLRWNNAENGVATTHFGSQWDYDEGNALMSSAGQFGAPYYADKFDSSSKLPGSPGIMPNSLTHNFAITMLVRVPHSSRQVVWLKGLWRGTINRAPEPGWLALTINGDNTGSYHGTDATANVVPGVQRGGVGLYAPNNLSILGANLHRVGAPQNATDDLGLYLITLVVDGDGTTIDLRVQGTASGSTAFDNSLVSVSREVIGSRVYCESQINAASQSAVDAYLEGFDSFSGDVLECVTYFANDSGGGTHNDTSATWDDEVEKVEGYIAHRWGVASNVLPSVGHSYGPGNIPTGGSSTVYEAIQPGAISGAMVSKDGILGKLDLQTGSVYWAVEGSGIGYGLAVDAENDGIYTTGPNLAIDSSEQTAPLTIVHRKVTDNGLTVDADLPAKSKFTVTALPADGDLITINDGVTTTVFEFDTAGDGVSGGNTEIDSNGVNVSTLAQNIITGLSAGGSICEVQAIPEQRVTAADITAYPFTIEVFSRLTSTLTVTVTSPGGEIAQIPSGDTVQATVATDGWVVKKRTVDSPVNQHTRLAVDYEGDVYIPQSTPGGSKANHILKRAKADGAEVFTITPHNVDYGLDVNAATLVVAEADWNDDSLTSPEFLWSVSSNDDGSPSPDRSTVHKTRLVQKTPLNVEARTVDYYGVAGGNLYQISRAPGTATLVQSAVVGADSIWVDSATAFGELFIVDNGTYKVHSPRKYSTDPSGDHTVEWKSKSGGEIPKGCKLVASYRGRVLLAGGDDPYSLHASAIGDPYNWDFFPRVADDESRAWSGTSIAAVRNPDHITAIAPWYDNAVLIGGDRTLTMLGGDPTTGGGFNLITDATGMAFGDSWALASNGSVYFMGSRGGIWNIVPPVDGRITPPVEVTERTVNRELTDIDFSKTKARLVWHEDEDALQVILARNTAATADVETEHWWFEAKTGAWWKDKFKVIGRVPQTVAVFDGDEPDDRIVVFGCEDGRIRYWDRDALSDDGHAIESEVLIGPIVPAEAAEFEQKVQSIEATLAGEFGGCRWELYAAEDPEFFGEPVAAGDFKSGFSGKVRARARGGTLWLRLLNAAANQNWALESLFLDVLPGARRRAT